MITYVNTVFVSNNTPTGLGTKAQFENGTLTKGQFLIMNCDPDAAEDKLYITAVADLAGVDAIKIGMATGKKAVDHKGVKYSEVRWSNIIKKHDIKSIATLNAGDATPSEDSVVIDFSNLDQNIAANFAEGGKRIIVRLTFKDTPTRYRKWTESYEYITKFGDDASAIATGIADLITKQWKRARVEATAASGVITLVALPYDDDNDVHSLNWANKGRFSVALYYTDPAAEGWESLNKHMLTGVTIDQLPGYRYPAEAKLVRDRENQSFGYLGILNRGNGTWPIVQPEMNTNLDYLYSAVTLEFENMYRAADDIFRKTKQTVEIYFGGAEAVDPTSKDVVTVLAKFAENAPIFDELTEMPAGVSEETVEGQD